MKPYILSLAFPFLLLLAPISFAASVSDTTNGLPSIIDITENQEAVLWIPKPSQYQSFEAMTTADVNKDGYGDILMECRPGNGTTSSLRIFYGNPSISTPGTFDESGIKGLTINLDGIYGSEPDDFMTGDVNGDGITDIIIHSPDTYVIYGETDWEGETTFSTNSPGLTRIYAETAPGTRKSLYDAWISDINNDGMTDILISSNADKYPTIESNFPRQIQIFYGSESIPASVNLYNTNMKCSTILPDTSFQISFNELTSGDLDNDGKPEIITTAGTYRFSAFDKLKYNIDTYHSRNHIIFGSVINSPQFSNADIDLLNNISGIVPIMKYPKEKPAGTFPYDVYYNSLSSGDINGDGYDDVCFAFHNIITLYGSQKEYNDYAEIFLVYGKNEFIWSGKVEDIAGVKFRSAIHDDGLGYYMDFCDVNGDGFQDFLIGLYNENIGQKYINGFYIVYGRNAFPDSIMVGPEFPYGTTVNGARFMGCGDINGDGYDDVLGDKDGSPFILFGKSRCYGTGETIVRELPRSTKSHYAYRFDNGSGFHFRFTQGGPSHGTKLRLANFGRSLPDSLSDIPTGDGSGIVSFVSLELTNMPASFQTECSFSYSDSAIEALGIREDDLMVSYWDEERLKWSMVESILNKERNRLTFTTRHFSLWAIADTNNSVVASVEAAESVTPEIFKLEQNYPNPFNPATTIHYHLAKSANVILRVYNILGQEVRTLAKKHFAEGDYEARWDGADNFGNPVASGIYIYRLETDAGFVSTRKMILLR